MTTTLEIIEEAARGIPALWLYISLSALYLVSGAGFIVYQIHLLKEGYDKD